MKTFNLGDYIGNFNKCVYIWIRLSQFEYVKQDGSFIGLLCSQGLLG